MSIDSVTSVSWHVTDAGSKSFTLVMEVSLKELPDWPSAKRRLSRSLDRADVALFADELMALQDKHPQSLWWTSQTREARLRRQAG
jgi:hypothetical protein